MQSRGRISPDLISGWRDGADTSKIQVHPGLVDADYRLRNIGEESQSQEDVAEMGDKSLQVKMQTTPSYAPQTILPLSLI